MVHVLVKCHVLKTSLPLKSQGSNPHTILGVTVRAIIQAGPEQIDYPFAQPVERDSRVFFFRAMLGGLSEGVTTRSLQDLLSM